MKDLTDYFLVSPYWFLLGVIIFFFLSINKIYVAWYIPQKYFNPQYKKQIFQNYLTSLIKELFKNSTLIKSSIRFLLIDLSTNFEGISNKQSNRIKKILLTLNGFTDFLKPYLLFSFFWFIIGIWISKEIEYERTKITLGHIQLLLAFLDSFSITQVFLKYKLLFVFLLGVLLVLTPMYKKDASNKIRKYFSNSLIYLSLLLNISFFGANVGEEISKNQKELKALQTEIINIHESIYQDVTTEIVLNSTIPTIKSIEEYFSNEAQEFQELIDSLNELNLNDLLRDTLRKELDEYLLKFKAKTLINHLRYQDYNIPIKSSTPYHDFVRKNTGEKFTDEITNWNIENGLDKEKIIREYFLKGTNRRDKVLANKLSDVLDLLIRLGLDTTVEAFFSFLQIEDHKTLRTFVEILLSNQFKKDLIDKITPYFDSSKKIDPKPITIIEKTFSTRESTFHSSFTDYFHERKNALSSSDVVKKKILIKENLALSKRIIQKYKELDNSYYVTDDEIKKHMAELSKSNINELNHFNSELKKLKTTIFKSSSIEELKKSLTDIYIFEEVEIHSLCGLPYSFPFCPVKAIR